MKISQLNGNGGIGSEKLYDVLFAIENQWHPSMADNADFLRSYAEKVYEHALVFGILENNSIVGLAAFYANDIVSKQSYLTYIGLFEQYTSKGIGTILLLLCEKTAKARQMTKMKLEVEKNNERAIRFYNNNGYLPMDEDDLCVGGHTLYGKVTLMRMREVFTNV